MDVVKIDKAQKQKHILVNDHIPNRAFKNEFQTNHFTLKLHKIFIYENQLGKQRVQEGGSFLVLDMSIRNNTSESLELLSEEFLLSYDDGELFTPEICFHHPKQFEDVVTLDALQQKRGLYIFLVASNCKKISLHHFEWYGEEDFKRYRLRYKL